VIDHVATWDDAYKARMNPVLAYLQRDQSLKHQELDEALGRYNNLIQRLEEGGVADASALSATIDEQVKVIEAVAEESVTMAWDAFREIHPESKSLPAEMRNEFASACGNMYALFGDKPHMLHMIKAAYEFSAWKTKTNLDELRNPRAALAPVTTARAERQGRPLVTPNSQAERQALVAETGMAYTQPRRSLDSMSQDDIMDQHDKLLDL
jgi:hypothetical protein